jgi:hypothetical protein
MPELFSAAVQASARREPLAAVPYFAGLMAGESGALIRSFAGEPELHHPVRGRVKGARAFEAFVGATHGWLAERNASVEAVDLSTWPLTGGHAIRPPLLQPDPDVHEADVVGEYQRALAIGDADAVVATFEPDAYVREPAGGAYIHRVRDALRSLYELFFSNGGGIPLEHCTSTDNGRTCALEYNVVRWGRTEMPPEAGIAVYVRGTSGRLAVARIYDDTDPPLTPHE